MIYDLKNLRFTILFEMSWFSKVIESIKGNEDFSDIKSSTVRDVINGNFLTKNFIKKQYKLILLMAFLAFMYINNRYECETQLAHAIELKKQIKDLKYESLTISAQLMGVSRQTSIMQLLNEKGIPLKEAKIPAIVIERTNENEKTK